MPLYLSLRTIVEYGIIPGAITIPLQNYFLSTEMNLFNYSFIYPHINSKLNSNLYSTINDFILDIKSFNRMYNVNAIISDNLEGNIPSYIGYTSCKIFERLIQLYYVNTLSSVYDNITEKLKVVDNIINNGFSVDEFSKVMNCIYLYIYYINRCW